MDALSHLGQEDLPAIADRIATFERARLDPTAMVAAFEVFRRATGSRRADDDVDIARGVSTALSLQGPGASGPRPEVMRAAAERLLLERSLEGIGTTEAGRQIVRLLALGDDAWGFEGKRIAARCGKRCVAVWIETRASANADIRRWGRGALERFGLSTPASFVEVAEPQLLADVLRALGTVRSLDAMRVIVAFVGNPRSWVREAARWALVRFGVNAIWVARESYEAATGRAPDPSWGWRRTMNELFAILDAARTADADREIAEGTGLRDRGDLGGAIARFDSALARVPDHERRAELAPVYASRAAEQANAGEIAVAAALYRRAAWMAPAHPGARAWTANAAVLDAEVHARSGALDVYAMASAERAEGPARRIAAERIASIPKPDLPRGKKIAALVAAMLLAGVSLYLSGYWIALRLRLRSLARSGPHTSAIV